MSRSCKGCSAPEQTPKKEDETIVGVFDKLGSAACCVCYVIREQFLIFGGGFRCGVIRAVVFDFRCESATNRYEEHHLSSDSSHWGKLSVGATIWWTSGAIRYAKNP